MKHKIIPMIVCLMLCVALMPAAAFADSAKATPAAPTGIWTDYAADKFEGGSGTKADPYQIGTPEQLAKLAKDVNGGESYAGKYFRMTADLDLSEHVWMPIGLQRWIGNSKENKPFAGSFDGGGRTISGMIVDQRKDVAERYSGGLFGVIRNTGAAECGVRNLTIADGKIYFYNADGEKFMGNGMLAGVAGDHVSSVVDFEGITISGGSIQSFGDKKERIAGGMLGNVAHARVSDCSVKNIRISGATNSGGFVGWNYGSVYRNCSATGELSGHWSLGGFVGYASSFTDNGKEFDPYFQHCLADVDITADDWNAGGFVGYAEYADILNCVAKGNVTSTKTEGLQKDPKVGAFAGHLYICEVEKCHAAGSATEVQPDYVAGGFAGYLNENGNTFKDCSFDSTLNHDIKAVGGYVKGTDPKDYDGIAGVPTQAIKGNICRDYDGKHTLKEVTGKDATCTEDGFETYWKCDACGSMYSDKDGTQIIDSPIVIPATGHKFSDWKVIKEAKVGVEGSRERACVNCDYTETEVIPALEVKDTAKTGDASTPALYGLLALLAAGGAAGALCRRRKA